MRKELHKYIGTTQVYEDTSIWQDLAIASVSGTTISGSVQYMAINGVIVFKSKLDTKLTSTDNNGSVTFEPFPSSLVAVTPNVTSFNSTLYTTYMVSMSGNTLTIKWTDSGANIPFPLTAFTFSYTQQN
ncbi:MAG TPA: hypothetical protein DDW71_00340 [Lactobacillus sp.]|nr:hypothetical protein [Lactobacillus sp.]